MVQASTSNTAQCSELVAAVHGDWEPCGSGALRPSHQLASRPLGLCNAEEGHDLGTVSQISSHSPIRHLDIITNTISEIICMYSSDVHTVYLCMCFRTRDTHNVGALELRMEMQCIFVENVTHTAESLHNTIVKGQQRWCVLLTYSTSASS